MLITTKSTAETKKLGEKIAREMKKGGVICLSGNLGSGKTTFTQGFLKGLKIKGPYTSPTFVIMKQYHKTHSIKHKTKKSKMLHAPCSMLHDVFHIDAYRVNDKDILNLGWEEMIQDKKNIILVEWAERIKKIIPPNALWIKFKWKNENEREIIFKNKQ